MASELLRSLAAHTLSRLFCDHTTWFLFKTPDNEKSSRDFLSVGFNPIIVMSRNFLNVNVLRPFHLDLIKDTQIKIHLSTLCTLKFLLVVPGVTTENFFRKHIF